MSTEKITFSHGKKFDIQLSKGLLAERRLADVFEFMHIMRAPKIELKTEEWQWEQTGNICVEYEHNGRPSGIAATEADMWVHELTRDGCTLAYLMFPINRLKELARAAMKAGQFRTGAGDDGLSSVVLLRLRDILR